MTCDVTGQVQADQSPDTLEHFFMERVRANTHVVLCMSPVGEAFRQRCRTFPGALVTSHHADVTRRLAGLVNGTTIDWFTEWPDDALYEVALKQFESEDLVDAEELHAICQVPKRTPLSIAGR